MESATVLRQEESTGTVVRSGLVPPDASSLYCSDGKQVGEVWIGKEDAFSTGSPKAVPPVVPPSATALQRFASRDLIAEASDIRKASELL